MTQKCIGYGEFEGKCTNEVCSKSPHWCERCEELRRDAITKQLEDLAKYARQKAEG